MMILLGDYVTATRELGDDVTVVSGRVSGIVLKENGDLKYFYIKGIDSSLWMSDNWQFETEEKENEND
jgi:hypothetical protein